MIRKLLALFVLLYSGFTYAQLDTYQIEPPYYIKTVQLNDGKLPKPSPFIEFGHHIYFSFDDLQADNKDYYYKVVRYNENWQPTRLNESEYISGFASDLITDINSSSGTVQSYSHYNLELPNESTKILLSGNYMLQVLDEDEELLFSKAFVLYKKDINVGVQVKWANSVQMKDRWQSVDFSLYKSGKTILNESENLTVRVFQNRDMNYYKEYHQPTYYKGEEWVYHNPNTCIFEGINEFRRFETRDLRGYNYGIARRELNELYDFYPYGGDYREHYLYFKDINGSYIVAAEQAEDKQTEGDYVNVHFSFNGALQPGESVYLFGRLNDFNPSDTYRLQYDEKSGDYHLNLLLKQAYYDYMYVIKDAKGNLDIAAIEGSYSQTENDYTVLVYYHTPGGRFTEVIGFGEANSDQIK